MANKTLVSSGTYSAGDIKTAAFERRAVGEMVDHVSVTKQKLYVKAKLSLETGAEGDEVEIEITAAMQKKVLTDSGLAALIVVEANKKLGA